LRDIKAPTFSRQITDGGEVVSLMHQLAFTPRKIPGSVAERIKSIEKCSDLTGNQIRILLAYGIMPHHVCYLYISYTYH
jgi:hypothetical protein